MRSWTLAFLLGILLLQQFIFLPSIIFLGMIVTIIVTLEFFFIKKYQFLRYISAISLGFLWALLCAHKVLSWNLPTEIEGKPLLIRGYIASIPNEIDNGTSFLFSLKTIQSTHVNTLIKLSARDNDLKKFRAGDRWQFLVKLKRIHGLMNPGGFDYESWAFQEGIRATGYVISNTQNILLESHWTHGFLNRLRQRLKEKIEENLPLSNTSPWIVALAVGERQNISTENWEVLRNTGTNHLMAIAGLHIGFMSGLVFFLASQCWRRIPRCALIIPAQLVGGFFAFLTAILYGALAGFSIPAERACIMLSVALLMLLMRRTILSWQAWFIALLIVLLINPMSVLTDSFWLSFCSVALIIYGVSARLHPNKWWWKLGRIQWVIALGLIPLSIGLFQQVSFISFIANSIAIPWVGFIIVPFTLMGCFVLIFSVKLGGFILTVTDKSLAILWKILTYFSHLPWANEYLMMPNDWILLAACVGVVIILLPSGFKGKGLGILWFFPLFFYHYPTPAWGEIVFTLLDVGQGLSTVVQTKNHVLVFDTGAKIGTHYDMGDSVVAPFLRSIGIKKIDELVISHPDNDHIGGAKSLFHYFKIQQAQTSTPDELLPFPSQYCLRGNSWEWDGVQFKFLYPTPDNLNLDNDSSCVLLITNSMHRSILLTGDIEKWAENYLVENEGKNLAIDILVAPHHGSKTSAVDEFIQNTHPSYVLFPVGYRNRYHFPHVIVIEKYEAIHANLLRSDTSGAIQFTLAEKVGAPVQYRLENQRYWNFFASNQCLPHPVDIY